MLKLPIFSFFLIFRKKRGFDYFIPFKFIPEAKICAVYIISWADFLQKNEIF